MIIQIYNNVNGNGWATFELITMVFCALNLLEVCVELIIQKNLIKEKEI